MTDLTVVGMSVQPAVEMTAMPVALAAIEETVLHGQRATATARLVRLVKVEPVSRLACALATLLTVREQVATATARHVPHAMVIARSVQLVMAIVRRDHHVMETVRSVRPVMVTDQPETSVTTEVHVTIEERAMTGAHAAGVLSVLVAPVKAVLVRTVRPGSSESIASAIRTVPRAQ
jgi:hypothetical protein